MIAAIAQSLLAVACFVSAGMAIREVTLVAAGRKVLADSDGGRRSHQRHRDGRELDDHERAIHARGAVLSGQHRTDGPRGSKRERDPKRHNWPEPTDGDQNPELDDQGERQHGVDLREREALVSGERHHGSVGPDRGDER